MFLETRRVLPFILRETDYVEPEIFGRYLQKLGRVVFWDIAIIWWAF